ncbi:MAG: hypothetical protein RLZZ568_80 [Cyanobacteriota bacterium]|jgi:hypothetical protein
MRKRRVLVFPAGTEIGLEIHKSLQSCKEVEIFGGGQLVSHHALFTYDKYYVLPSIREEQWLESLVNLCQEICIDYIFPAHDDVIVALARHQEVIPAKVLIPSLETCLVTRSKSLTYKKMASAVCVPRLYTVETANTFPLIVKPDKGQGSQGVQLVNNQQELLIAISKVREPIICEYLPHEEYTIDCFSDREKGILFCGARLRIDTRNGIAVHTYGVSLEEAQSIASRVQSILELRGAWFFQLKRNAAGELTLLEIAPRIAGSMSTHRVTGVNFPLLTIFEEERLALSILTNSGTIEVSRALYNRYRHTIFFGTLYVDLDDTLILDNQVNTEIVQLIFQCINQGKYVKLVTRHSSNLAETLIQYRLGGLFDKVIHLREGEPKSACISENDAIFIDDSFAERCEVSMTCGIPTFDCSMIELLIQQTKNPRTSKGA